jgi:hypothetical protein
LDNQNEIEHYGGYLTNTNNKQDLIHKSHKILGNTKFIRNDVIHCINYLQSVPFAINK